MLTNYILGYFAFSALCATAFSLIRTRDKKRYLAMLRGNTDCN